MSAPSRTVLVVGVALALGACEPSAFAVSVTNDRLETMPDLEVRVTGAVYPLGALEAGETVEVGVRPTGESAVYLVDSVGDTLTAVGYLEAGYRGTAAFVLEGDSVRVAEFEVDL